MKKSSLCSFAIIVLLTFACKDKIVLKSQEADVMSKSKIDALKKTTKTYLTASNMHDTLLQHTITTKNFVRIINGEVISYNQSELSNSMRFWLRAMPDFKIIEKEITVAENKTYVIWLGSGSNTEMFGNQPPTGKIGHTEGMSILTFDSDGHITQETTYFDRLRLLEEWGYEMSPPIMN